MIDLDAIKARLTASRDFFRGLSGEEWPPRTLEWYVSDASEPGRLIEVGELIGPDQLHDDVAHVFCKPDADLIAHAPTDIAALVAEVERLRAALASAPEQTIRAILPAGWWLRDTVAGWTVGRTVEGVDTVTSRGRTPVEAATNASAFSQAAWQEHRRHEAQLGDVNGLLDAAGYPRGAEGVRAMADDLGRCRRAAREAAERAEEALATVAARLGAR